MSRLLVRRSLTAVGIYSSVALGFLATVVAGRVLSKQEFGDYATVIYATSFFQSFFDLTVEEALVKYGFRFVTRRTGACCGASSGARSGSSSPAR